MGQIINLWRRTALALAIVFAVVGLSSAVQSCAAVKKIVRTANDAAEILCELFAVENSEALGGIDPIAWCSVRDNLDPFLDEILAAQRNAAALSLNRTSGGEAPAPPSDGDGVASESAPDETEAKEPASDAPASE